MMVGLAGSGKSTLAEKLAKDNNAVIHSSDAVCIELSGGDYMDMRKKDEALVLTRARIIADLRSGKNVVCDATNLNSNRRRGLLDEIKKFGCEKVCYFIATPYEECLERVKNEGRVYVPKQKVFEMYCGVSIPQMFEGWNKINIVWNYDYTKYKPDWKELMEQLVYVSQDNPHHINTIGIHCLKAEKWITPRTNSSLLILAARFHDIGKLETKVFTNMKGEPTKEAHFFQHHMVGGYKAMFYLKVMGYGEEDILEICSYIQSHMQPYSFESTKTINRIIKLRGQKFYDNLMLLHEADENSQLV
jgi:predicted kinase